MYVFHFQNESLINQPGGTNSRKTQQQSEKEDRHLLTSAVSAAKVKTVLEVLVTDGQSLTEIHLTQVVD